MGQLVGILLIALCGSGIVSLGLLVYVWLHRDEPLKMAAHVCWVGAALELVLAIVVFGFVVGDAPEEVRTAVRLVGLVLIAEAAVFFGLSLGILKESRVCAGLAFAFYGIGTLVAFKGLAGAYLGGLMVVSIRGTFTTILGWAFWDTIKMADLDAIAAQRRSAATSARTTGYFPPPRAPIADAWSMLPRPSRPWLTGRRAPAPPAG